MLYNVCSSVASLETAAEGNNANTTDAPPPPKKANRCQVCKKRVGLTGLFTVLVLIECCLA